MLSRFHAEADDSFLAERLGGFQPVQALDQHETRAIRTHQDWCLLADFEHAGSDFVHALSHKRGPTFDGHEISATGKVSRFIMIDLKR